MHHGSSEAFEALVTIEKCGFERSAREAIERILEETLPDATRLVMASSPAYPEELLVLEEHPAVLVCEGDINLTSRQLRISIVGSQAASEEAKADAFQVSKALAERGAVIVSGLAQGIDTAAHEGALSAQDTTGARGRTIAIIGTPLAQPWPPANVKLARRIAAYGLLISLAPQVSGLSFTDKERLHSHWCRNRAIAALGCGTLVMAGKEGSSTLREVEASLALGRSVLLWHTLVNGATAEPWALALLEEAPKDEMGRPLVRVVQSADEVEAALSPWTTVWWL